MKCAFAMQTKVTHASDQEIQLGAFPELTEAQTQTPASGIQRMCTGNLSRACSSNAKQLWSALTTLFGASELHISLACVMSANAVSVRGSQYA